MPAPWEPSLRPPRPGMDGVGAVLPGESSLTRGEEDSHEGSCSGGRDSRRVGSESRPRTRAMKRRHGLPPGAAPSGCAGCSSRTAPACGGFGLTALAAGGLHPADVRVGDGPSAQAKAQADWAASGAGPARHRPRALAAGGARGRDRPDADHRRAQLRRRDARAVRRAAAVRPGRGVVARPTTSSGRSGWRQSGAPQPILDALAAFLRSQQTATGGWNFTEGARERVGGHDRRRRRRAVRGRGAESATPRWRRRSRSCASARTR